MPNKEGQTPAEEKIDISEFARAGADDNLAEWEQEGADETDRGDTPAEETPGDTQPEEGEQEPETPAPEEEGEDPDTEEAEAEEAPEAKGEKKPKSKADAAEDEEEADDDEPNETPSPKDEKPRSKVIPRKRFDEVNNKLKEERRLRQEAEARLAAKAEAEKKEPPKDPDLELKTKIDELKDKYEEALLDGDKAKAKDFRKQIGEAEEQLIDSKAQRAANKARETVPEDLALDATITELETKYPAFDKKSDAFDPDLTDEVLTVASAYQSKGMKPAAALRKAAETVAKANGLEAPEVEDAEDEAEEPPKKEAKKPAKEPTKEQRKEKLKQAQGQPPKGAPNAKDEGEPDADDLTEAEFDALPESKKRALRGDSI